MRKQVESLINCLLVEGQTSHLEHLTEPVLVGEVFVVCSVTLSLTVRLPSSFMDTLETFALHICDALKWKKYKKCKSCNVTFLNSLLLLLWIADD